MADLPPPEPEGRSAPPHPPPPVPPPVPAPVSWPTPSPSRPPRDQGRGFPWKVLGVLAVLVVIAVVVVGFLVARFFGGGGFTAHVDRANQYLDALRTDPASAAAMRCPGAEDPLAQRLSSSIGQYLSGFEVTDGRGEVTGSVQFPDGSTPSVVVVTSGPTFPSGDDPAAEVCIVSTRLP